MLDFTQLKQRLNAMLFIAAAYFVLWGLVVLIFPHSLHSILIETASVSLIFWDLIAVFTITLGIGLLIAAFDPFRNWLIMFVNLLFHLAIIGGFLVGLSKGYFSSTFLPFLFFNHMIWMIPLIAGMITVYNRSFRADKVLINTFNEEDYPLELFETVSGKNLQELSEEEPVLLVFLRHFGCPFCQETLISVQENREKLEEKGTKIVLVYMVNEKIAYDYLTRYGLQDLEQLGDPESIAYKRFALNRGNLIQLLGLKVIFRWIWLGLKKRIFFTKVEGDIYQMPGFFLIRKGKVVRSFVHKTSADQPDYSRFMEYQE